MDLWHGHIEFDDEQQSIQDLHFTHAHLSRLSLPQHASLRFLAIIEAASVPLYLAAGPSLDVWTDNGKSKERLHQCLIDETEADHNGGNIAWWARSGGQSEHGILVGVKDQSNETTANGLEITEVLIYAAHASPQSAPDSLPTPPESSSPGHEVARAPKGDVGSSIRLYALPLSSKIFGALEHPSIDPSTAPLPSADHFHYLSLPYEPFEQRPASGNTRKRPKIETIFQDAAQARRQHKKQGGQGISKAMAGLDQMPKDTTSVTNEGSSAKRAPLSRAATTGSFAPLPLAKQATARPQSSRRMTQTSSRPQSSLRRVDSILSPSIDESHSPIPEDTSTEIEQQNKASLSRIIMTGMRMYGLQQQRKKSMSGASAWDTQSLASTSTSGQDEYKAVYHQTFKAVAFAFRRCWKDSVVRQEKMRDTVDVFLEKFCGEQGGGSGGGLEGELETEFGFGL
ncbi:MAG: hypothetical protein Q9174_005372 [Haloplaca sp. 1 TL-2023]